MQGGSWYEAILFDIEQWRVGAPAAHSIRISPLCPHCLADIVRNDIVNSPLHTVLQYLACSPLTYGCLERVHAPMKSFTLHHTFGSRSRPTITHRRWSSPDVAGTGFVSPHQRTLFLSVDTRYDRGSPFPLKFFPNDRILRPYIVGKPLFRNMTV